MYSIPYAMHICTCACVSVNRYNRCIHYRGCERNCVVPHYICVYMCIYMHMHIILSQHAYHHNIYMYLPYGIFTIAGLYISPVHTPRGGAITACKQDPVKIPPPLYDW